MARLTLLGLIFSLVASHSFTIGVLATSFTFENKCEYTVWPAIFSSPSSDPISTTGFALRKGETNTISTSDTWIGRFWGRTVCSQDSNGNFTCATADCGSGKLECSERGASPPATLVEFKLSLAGDLDFYDVSLVDGYNLPVLVTPQGGTGNCTSTGCPADLNGECPSELRVPSKDGAEVVACKSACVAFQQPQYCCTGAYASRQACKPSSYSQIFKKACPQAYTYAYDDDATSTFTCAHADYFITFCPPAPITRYTLSCQVAIHREL